MNYDDLKKIVKKNLVFQQNDHEEIGGNLLEKDPEVDTSNVEKYSIITIFKHKSILVVTIMMCFAWYISF